jgi:hypothetical protein
MNNFGDLNGFEDLQQFMECPPSIDDASTETIAVGLCADGHIVCTPRTQRILQSGTPNKLLISQVYRVCPVCRGIRFTVVSAAYPRE